MLAEGFVYIFSFVFACISVANIWSLRNVVSELKQIGLELNATRGTLDFIKKTLYLIECNLKRGEGK